MTPKTDRGNIVRFCLLWTLFIALGSEVKSLEFDGQNREVHHLFLLGEDQRQNQEGSVSVEINWDLIFSPKSPLRSANQKPVKVKFNLPGLGQAIATINEYNFINQKEYSHNAHSFN